MRSEGDNELCLDKDLERRGLIVKLQNSSAEAKGNNGKPPLR
jgi:hypothetical protein